MVGLAVCKLKPFLTAVGVLLYPRGPALAPVLAPHQKRANLLGDLEMIDIRRSGLGTSGRSRTDMLGMVPFLDRTVRCTGQGSGMINMRKRPERE